ncbi:hypothetical protein GCM10009755_23260 [Brevibacterium samyangense]|uniref:Uncharacterized protein n=1 Tax=Brevibacterium samyangense TaxID=366888 RepID=A0ABN2TJV9_9MICO
MAPAAQRPQRFINANAVLTGRWTGDGYPFRYVVLWNQGVLSINNALDGLLSPARSSSPAAGRCSTSTKRAAAPRSDGRSFSHRRRRPKSRPKRRARHRHTGSARR